MKDLEGSVAVVTGAGSGIGRGMARVLARRNVRVVVSDVNADDAAKTTREIGTTGGTAIAVKTDVADLSAVRDLEKVATEAFGGVDILCNNAGVSQRRRGTHATHEDWTWMIAVNLWGVIHGIEAFLPSMLASGKEAHIVNTASMNGIIPSAFSAMYSASKYGVVGLSETLRNELQGTRVGISILCPAGVRTRIGDSERNRPPSLTPPTPPPSHTPSSTFDLSAPLEPEDVGDMVAEAILRDQFYVFTDMKVRSLIEQHHERMMRDFDVLADWQNRFAPGG